MFKRKKKKTGCETPEFRSKVPMPPVKPAKSTPTPLPAEEFTTRHPRTVTECCIDTEDKLDVFMSKHEDILKIENAEIYWSVKDGVLAVVATQEWKNYLTGISNMIPNAKENLNGKDVRD